jgi:hypothetical protein
MAQFESSWTGSQDIFSDGEFRLFDDEARFFDWNNYLEPRLLSGHSNVVIDSARIDYKVSPEAFVDFAPHPLGEWYIAARSRSARKICFNIICYGCLVSAANTVLGIANDAGNIITPTIPSSCYGVPDFGITFLNYHTIPLSSLAAARSEACHLVFHAVTSI